MRNSKQTATVLSGVVLVLTATCLQAQDWPQWRGPNRDAKASGFNAPKTWPKELTAKWKVTVGDGVATPSLVGEKLYVFSRQSGAEIIRCLDTSNGKELWQDKYDTLGASGPASGFSGPRATPFVADGKIVTLGVRGVLSCLAAVDGKLIWRKDDFKGTYPRFFVSSSPLVIDGLCVAQMGAGDNGGVFAYDLSTGNEKWKWTGGSPAYSSPVLMAVDGTKLVVAMTETKIVALSLEDGKQVWETPFAVQGRGYNAATPIVNGQTLVYSGSGRGVTAVKLEKNGSVVTAKEVWKNSDNSVMFDTPVLKSGLLFGLTAGDDFFCINAANGKTAWTAPSKKAAATAEGQEGGGGRMRGGRGGYGSIVDAGSVVLALTPSSELIAFEPSEKAFTELARIKVATTPTYAYPILSGNQLFIKDQDSVMLYVIQ